MITGNAFFRCYGDPYDELDVLDVGSLDVNGTLRSCATPGCHYTGIDLQPGPGVDLVIKSRYDWAKLDVNGFDLVISTSCFEHDPMFWVTFIDMARVLRPGGFIYISTPANGPYHGYPGDCWRFYKDSALALARWAQHCDFDLELIESFQMQPRQDVWIDQVMVFGKPPVLPRKSIQEFLCATT